MAESRFFAIFLSSGADVAPTRRARANALARSPAAALNSSRTSGWATFFITLDAWTAAASTSIVCRGRFATVAATEDAARGCLAAVRNVAFVIWDLICPLRVGCPVSHTQSAASDTACGKESQVR